MFYKNSLLEDYVTYRQHEKEGTPFLDIQAYYKDGKHLIWIPSLGVGYYPVRDFVYDEEYFEKYIEYENTDISNLLMKNRTDFVEKNATFDHSLDIVDIGVGSGEYCRWQNCSGFDVNPAGIRWLKKAGRYINPYQEKIKIATFWDSIEHIENPRPLLDMITDYAFVSCPIYDDFEHIIRSKHFRTDEHYFYYTKKGFISLMDYLGFELMDTDEFEIRAGRESIVSFAFKRK